MNSLRKEILACELYRF